MTGDDHWERVRRLFERAVRIPAQERRRLLLDAYPGDPELRRDVERLLAADEDKSEYMEPPPHEELLRAGGDGGELAARRVGDYQLEQELGRGGMATVCRARGPDGRHVAIKLIRRGMDTEDILRRFQRERRLLGELLHPGIARLLDAGTTSDARPYLVLDLVEGEPIDRYCDERRLGITERLLLVAEVCEAVHHAHERGVVHRDLKPANVLVTAERRPVLLDFGIAKLIDSTASSRTVDVTATELRLMTPEYASPEQVLGGPVGPPSDVYSLGVLLYELLTGHRPYRLTTRLRAEMERAICEEVPERPSLVVRRNPAGGGTSAARLAALRGTDVEGARRRLAGKLDTICLVALHKEARRRYPSADELRRDLLREVEGHPIAARPDTWGYRTARFVRRNRTLVGATLGLALALSLGLALGLVLYGKASRASALAASRRDEARRSVYAAEIAAAHRALEARDVRGAWDHLDRAPREWRGWEWRHLAARVDRSEWRFVLAQGETTADVIALAFSPDGDRLALGGGLGPGNDVVLLDVATRTVVSRWRGFDGRVLDLEFDPRGEWLAAVADDGTGEPNDGEELRLWSTVHGEESRRLALPDLKPTTLSFHPDGRRLAVGGGTGWLRGRGSGGVVVLDLETLEVLRTLPPHESRINSVEYAPDGTLVVGSCDGLVLLHGADGEPPRVLVDEPDDTKLVAVGPRGERILEGGRRGVLTLWTRTGERLWSARHAWPTSLAFSPDGQLVASASGDRTVRLWDASTGEPRATLLGHSREVETVRFHPSGELLASGSRDETARLWSVRADDVPLLRRPEGMHHAVALDPAGTRVASLGGNSPAETPGRLDVFALPSRALVWSRAGLDPSAWALAFAPAGERLVGLSGTDCIVWNAGTGAELLRLPRGSSERSEALFDPRGRRIVAGSAGGEFTLWDAESGRRLRTFTGHERPVRALAFHPGGEILATGADGGRVGLWNVAAGECLGLEQVLDPDRDVWSLAFHPLGELLAVAGTDGLIRIRSPFGEAAPTLLRGPEPYVQCVRFTPDGERLVGAGGRWVTLWETRTWAEVATLEVDRALVTSLALCADGRCLASGSRDGEIRIFEARAPGDEPRPGLVGR